MIKNKIFSDFEKKYFVHVLLTYNTDEEDISYILTYIFKLSVLFRGVISLTIHAGRVPTTPHCIQIAILLTLLFGYTVIQLHTYYCIGKLSINSSTYLHSLVETNIQNRNNFYFPPLVVISSGYRKKKIYIFTIPDVAKVYMQPYLFVFTI